MTEFNTPIDVANRALQHCGQTRINPVLGFAEPTKAAAETSFAYPKVRRAELRRNAWRFATRKAALRPIDASTMLLMPAMWVAGTTYFVGSIVSDQSNNLWISNTANNLGNDPLASLTWEPYFGPLTVSLYDSATSYSAGELVYSATGNGLSRTYLSLQNGNGDGPATATAYVTTAVYSKNQVVTYLSVAYMSLIDLNTGNVPTSTPANWSSVTSYSIGNQVAGSDGIIYTSSTNANLNNDPTIDVINWTSTGLPVPWTTTFVGGAGSDKWRQIGGIEFPMGVGLVPLSIVYPLGSGPSSQGSTRNVYRLPSGYLRAAPQNPKATTQWLGGPSGITYNDWNFEGDFLVTSDRGVIILRFVADVTDVRRMDDMFCEGLAARVALEVCEPLTQSSAKLGTIAKVYDEWITQARTINAIEIGYDDPPDDDYITCRA